MRERERERGHHKPDLKLPLQKKTRAVWRREKEFEHLQFNENWQTPCAYEMCCF